MDAATGGPATDPHAQPGLMKPGEAAKYLQISQYTLQTWRSRNRELLPFVKVGHQVRYRREDLDRFVQANRSDAS